MGRCRCGSGRCILLAICSLQLVGSITRQVFNFLAPLWLAILADFFNIVMLIFGIFGACHKHIGYLCAYVVWSVAWLWWSIFTICLYLDVGILRKDNGLLDFGTGLVSWWAIRGPGCSPDAALLHFKVSDNEEETTKIEIHDTCYVPYQYVETAQAALQAFLACLAIPCCLAIIVRIRRDRNNCHSKSRATSLYSVEISSSRLHTEDFFMSGHDTPSPLPPFNGRRKSGHFQRSSAGPLSSSPRPMTPRKVKRRSLRGEPSGRTSVNSNHSSKRRSGRNQLPTSYVNPVTRLMNSGDHHGESSTSSNERDVDDFPPPPPHLVSTGSTLHVNTAYAGGHANPLYHGSEPSLCSAVSPTDNSISYEEEFHSAVNRRPPSARSSYSNYHGQRPFLIPQPQQSGKYGHKRRSHDPQNSETVI